MDESELLIEYESLEGEYIQVVAGEAALIGDDFLETEDDLDEDRTGKEFSQYVVDILVNEVIVERYFEGSDFNKEDLPEIREALEELAKDRTGADHITDMGLNSLIG